MGEQGAAERRRGGAEIDRDAAAARLGGDYTTALNQYHRAAPLLPAGDARAAESRQWVAALSDYLQVPVPEDTKD